MTLKSTSSTSATSPNSNNDVPNNIDRVELHKLIRKATEAKSLAYCPYSHFRVGCTVLTTNGTFIQGANVENASYPVGHCAEQNTLGQAAVRGFRMGDIQALAVATDISPAASPCGMCRQFIREFCELDMPIIMIDKDGEYVVKVLGELLPMAFGPEALPPPDRMDKLRADQEEKKG